METGVPCSNCTDYEKTCVIRRRKNQRQDATPSEDEDLGVANGSTNRDDTHSDMTPIQQTAIQSNTDLSSSGVSDIQHGTFLGTAWTDQTVLPDYFDLGINPSPAFTDFSHLTDLDDIFTFTANSLQPGRMQNEFSLPDGSSSWRFQAIDLPTEQSVYLQSQGCFDIPPEPVLYEMMLSYFRWIHPHLPILVEDRFWARWSGETFQMGDHSLLLLRAMLFACMSQVDNQVISKLGFASKREARQAFYQRAKLLFEFGTETDPLTLSRACLLMTYQSPRYTRLRVNTSWLKQAIHYARIARADSHRRFQNSDPDRAMVLKRIWWGVLFRDCILSLGTRRSPQINHEPESLWHREPESLVQEDFTSELGNSPVHSTEAQLRIIQLVGAMCRLVPCLASTAMILYTVEGIDDRLEMIDKTKAPILTRCIQRSLESLQTWHDETIPEFPFPVSLDMENTPEAVCLYANMLFIYHAAATFALNANLILLHEFFPASRSLINTEDCAKALQNGITDVSQRSQELLQVGE